MRMNKWVKIIQILIIAFIFSCFTPTPGNCVPFEVTFNFTGGFHIYGQEPDPHIYGFDYYFTPLALDPSLLGNGVTISSINVSAPGTSQGEVINWDWEVFLGPSPFGLPEGQFVATHVDPVSGYIRNAPTQLQFVDGVLFAQGNYIFSGNYDFVTNTMTATPSLEILKNASTSEMDLPNGLYAQLFFWTGDNRNCYISFEDVTLTVRGDISTPVPEPSTMFLLGSGLLGLWGFRRKFRK